MSHAHTTTAAGSTPSVPNETWLSWLVCMTAGLLFFYEFIQMNMFNSISADFMRTFGINHQLMGTIDSFYFIANVIFLIPAGYLLDRFSTRHVILIAMLLCVLGTALIGLSSSIFWAMLFRFITGIGSAFCFLSVIRLATHWFPAKRLGLVIGLIVTEAMLGGWVSQAPLKLLTTAMSWQHALLWDAGFGVLVFALIFVIVRDAPKGCVPYRIPATDRQSAWNTYRSCFKRAFLTGRNWAFGLYTSLINIPLAILGGIWGVSYLTARFGITSVTASSITGVLFFGMMIGSPLAGYLSDSTKRRSVPMVLGAVLLCVMLLLLLFLPSLSSTALFALFFLIGLLSGIQVVGYPAVAERASPDIMAMSVSVVNIAVMSGQAIFKPVFGWIIDWHHFASHAASTDQASDYQMAMYFLPVLVIAAVFLVIKKKSAPKKA